MKSHGGYLCGGLRTHIKKEMNYMRVPQQFPMPLQQPVEYPGRVAWQIPPPEKVRIEEILQLLLYLILSIYMTCHMLFLPIEALSLAFALDPDFKQMLTFMIIILSIKYIVVFIMFYCVYHHTNLWISHHHIVLYIFSILCLLTTAATTWFIVVSDEEMRKLGFGPIIDHPFFYDFIGFAASGVMGTVYIFYLACTKPPTVYSLLPPQELPMVYGTEDTSFPGLYTPQRMSPPVQPPVPVPQTQTQTEEPKVAKEEPQAPPMQPKFPSLPAFEYPGVFEPMPPRPQLPAMQMPIYFINN